MEQIEKADLDLFNRLTNKQFEEIKPYFEFQKFKKGDYIIRENESVNKIYIIKSGLVKLYFRDKNDNESILSFAFEDWWETDFTAFFNNSKSVLNLQCIEDTETFCLHFIDYNKIINEFKLADYFLQKSINGHIASQNRILSLLSNSPKEKYEQFLKIYPNLAQRIPKSTLALYLGVSRETLSRIYK